MPETKPETAPSPTPGLSLGGGEILALGARLTAAGLALTLVVVVLGRALVGSSGRGFVQPLDNSIRAWVQANLEGLVGAASLLAAVGATVLILIASAVVSALVWWRTRDLHRAALPVVSVVLADVVGALTKVAVGRPRPVAAEIGLLERYSFPSGHTVSTVALITALLLVWRASAARRIPTWLATLVSIVLAFMVAAGRIIVDAHWASDVVAATLIGVCSALIARWALASVPRVGSIASRPPGLVGSDSGD